MTDIIKISDSEWRLMHLLWSKESMTVAEMVDVLEEDTAWKPRTIKTLLCRLIDKGAVKVETQGRNNLYSAIVPQETCVEQESKSFLNRVYSGMTSKLLATFIENESLSNEDIEELQKMLENHKNKE